MSNCVFCLQVDPAAIEREEDDGVGVDGKLGGTLAEKLVDDDIAVVLVRTRSRRSTASRLASCSREVDGLALLEGPTKVLVSGNAGLDDATVEHCENISEVVIFR